MIANLTPLNEKYGQVLARSAGPYLVTLLSGSGSLAIREASAIALGNISLVRINFFFSLFHRYFKLQPSYLQGVGTSGKHD